MKNEQELKVPRWSRWHLLSKVSPSGKMLFVCLVCGRESIAPEKQCARPVKVLNTCGGDRSANVYPQVTCHTFEERVNHNRQFSLNASKKLDLAEMQLMERPPCRTCMGWGCNACGGFGR